MSLAVTMAQARAASEREEMLRRLAAVRGYVDPEVLVVRARELARGSYLSHAEACWKVNALEHAVWQRQAKGNLEHEMAHAGFAVRELGLLLMAPFMAPFLPLLHRLNTLAGRLLARVGWHPSA